MQSQPVANPGMSRRTLLGHGYAIAILIAVVIVSYGVFYAPILFREDWPTLARVVHGDAQWMYPHFRNALVHAPWLALYNLFGPNLGYYFFWLAILTLLASVQLYFIVLKLAPRWPIFALAVAALYAVYPTDYTHMWLIMLHIRTAVCLFLLYAWLLLLYADSGRLLLLGSAATCLAMSFLFYEAALGVSMLWCLVVALLRRHITWKRRLGLVSPILLGGAFAVWRTLGNRQFDASDSYLEVVHLVPTEIATRLVTGLKLLVWGWTLALRRALGPIPTWQALTLVALPILACWLVLIIVERKRSPAVDPKPSLNERLRRARPYLGVFVLGVAAAAAGYLPIVLAIEPSLADVDSRVTLLAGIGGALMIVSLLGSLVALVGRQGKRAQILLVAGVVPLLVLAMITQVWAQCDARTAWREQTQIWRELFVLAPDIVEGTMVYIVLPGYENRVGFENWQRTPLYFGWEPSNALRLLYGKWDLYANVVFPDLEQEPGVPGQPTPTESGIIDPWPEGNITPYEGALFVIFDGNPRHLRVLADLQSVLPISWPTPGYKPHERISQGPPPSTKWRYLVGEPAASGTENR